MPPIVEVGLANAVPRLQHITHGVPLVGVHVQVENVLQHNVHVLGLGPVVGEHVGPESDECVDKIILFACSYFTSRRKSL